MRTFFKYLFYELTAVYFAKIAGYYDNVGEISAYRWDKIENGDYSYLYKKWRRKKVPSFFKEVISDMFFQFDKVNIKYFRDMCDISYTKSLYSVSGKINTLNKVRILEAKFKKKYGKKTKHEKLNEKVNFIEFTLNNIGSIDVHKISASRFYSLLEKAIEISNKKTNGNN